MTSYKFNATFPIKKFNKVVAVLILYSNELDFFDSEAEILLIS